MPFESLNIIPQILKSLHEEGYRTPTPIQEQAIPIVLEGKDLLGVAQTGTGKTAAFAVPILQLLSRSPQQTGKPHTKRRHIRSLILTPTRELAVQIEESFRAYGRHVGLSSVVVFGGVKQGKQTSALRSGVDIVIATPGRLLDLMDQGYVNLQGVEIFVLDEADRMLDMGFVRDVEQILNVIPRKRQTLFFSATMPPAIVKLANSMLDHPVRVEVTPHRATVDLIEQSVYYVDKGKKPGLLLQLLDNQDIRTALVFTRTKHGADSVVRTLERNHISADAIHGNKSQNARQRALDNFKAQKTRVLVATDIAARGIDVDNLEYVINYEIPNVPETYVHRIGRTGRAGAAGTAISLCAPDEKSYIREIEKLINKRIPVVHEHPMAKSDRTRVEDVKPEGAEHPREHIRPRPAQGERARGDRPGERPRGDRPRGQHPGTQPNRPQSQTERRPQQHSNADARPENRPHRDNKPHDKPITPRADGTQAKKVNNRNKSRRRWG
jgi:ATP-dependent RNA helicase RhlE